MRRRQLIYLSGRGQLATPQVASATSGHNSATYTATASPPLRELGVVPNFLFDPILLLSGGGEAAAQRLDRTLLTTLGLRPNRPNRLSFFIGRLGLKYF